MPEEQVTLKFIGSDQVSKTIKTVDGNLKTLRTTVKQADGSFKTFTTTTKTTETELDQLALTAQLATAAALAALAMQAAKAGAALYKAGASSIAAREKLMAFAGGSAEATEMLDAFIGGLNGTVDRATATAHVLKLVQQDIIATSDEARQAGAIILKLGDPLLTMAQNSEKFAQMMANQSYRMVDTFGMSRSAIKAMAKDFEAMGYAADKAFQMAVLEEGARSVALVGDDVGQAAREVAVLEASFEDLKTTIGEGLVLWGETSGAIGLVTQGVQKLNSTLGHLLTIKAAVSAHQRVMIWGTREETDAREAFNAVMLKGAGIVSEEKDALLASNKAMREAAQAADAAALALERESASAAKATKQHLALALSLTSLYRRREKQQAAFARQAQDLERDHQQRLREIRNSAIESEQNREDRRYRQVLARLDAEQAARLEALRREYGMGQDFGSSKERLEAEHKRRMMGLYTDSARKQEVRRHAAAMKDLEYRTKESAIVSEFEGKKAKATEKHESKNQAIKRKAAAALIAEENTAYARSLADLARNRQDAEASYQDSLGRMKLQMIDYWESTGLISAEQAMAMRLAVIEQYNLLADEAIAALGRIPTDSFAGLGLSEGEKAKAAERGWTAPKPGTEMFEPKRALGYPTGTFAGQRIPGYALGTPSHPGGPAIVGEKGPEFLDLPRGSSVTPMAGNVTVNNYFGPQSVRSDRDIFMIAEAQATTLRRMSSGKVM